VRLGEALVERDRTLELRDGSEQAGHRAPEACRKVYTETETTSSLTSFLAKLRRTTVAETRSGRVSKPGRPTGLELAARDVPRHHRVG